MSLLLATSRGSDRELLDEAMALGGGPAEETLSFDSASSLLDRLREAGGRLIVLGLDGPEVAAPGDPLAEIPRLAPSTPVLLLADDAGRLRVGGALAFQVEGVLVRGDASAGELAAAISRALGGAAADSPPAGGSGGDPEEGESGRLRRALERSEEKYRKLFQSTPLGIALSTRDEGEFLEANEGFEALLGYRREELIGRRAPELDIWVDEERRERLVRRIQEAGEVRGLEARLRREDGEVIEAEISGQAIEVEGTPCLLTVTRDVTEQRRFERELEQSRERVQRYAAHLTSAREQERNELARDIHDHLGQILTGIKLKLSRLSAASATGEVPPRDAFEDVAELLDEAVQEVRDISTSLRPSAIDQFGLVDALQWQAERAADQFGIEVAVESSIDGIDLPKDGEIHVFRVVQEALTNVGRHADAGRAAVELERTEESFVVRVLDDGVGLDADAIESSDSHGVLGMEERAYVLGGSFSLRDRSEGGVEARLEVPLAEGS